MSICPVNFKSVDHTAIRLTALLTTVILLVGVLIDSLWFLLFVAVDFAVRAAGICPSPLATLASATVSFFELAQKPVDQGGKLFAARMGALGVWVGLGLALWGYTVAGWAVALAVGFFSLLEALFGFCAGCFLYALFTRRS